jgi:hypothetical protein
MRLLVPFSIDRERLMAERSTTLSPPSRLLRQARHAPVVEEVQPELRAAALPYADESDMQEAVSNFRLYLAILEEWDAKEKAADDGPPLQSPDD